MPTELYRRFSADPHRKERVLAWIDRLDRATGAEERLYFSDSRYASGAGDLPAHELHRAKISVAPNYTAAVADLDTLGAVGSGSGGVLTLAIDHGDLDVSGEFDRGRYSFDGRSVRILEGGWSPSTGELPLADYRPRDFRAGEPEVDLRHVRLPLEPRRGAFSDRLQRRTFRGSGYCLHLQGGGAHVNFGAPAALNLTGDLTLAMWVWIDPASAGGTRRLLTWRQSGATYPFDFYLGGSGRLNLAATGVSTAASGIEVPTDRWVHLAAIREGLTVTFAVFDEVAQSETVTVAAVDAAAQVGTAVCTLGRQISGGVVGLVSEVWVSGEALGLDELRRRRPRPLSAAEAASVAAYWSLDQTSGAAVVDSGPGGIAGALSGAGVFVPSLEGHAGLAGATKRDALGLVLHSKPTEVDHLKGFYYAHGGRLAALEPMEGGLAYAPGTEHVNVFSFLAAPTPATGTVDTFRSDAGSYFRLAKRPTLPVGFRSETGIGAPADTAASLTKEILLTRGRSPLSPGEILPAWVNRLQGQAPGKAGFQAGEETTIREALDLLLGRSAGAQYWFRRQDSLLWAQQLVGVPELVDAAGDPVETLELAAGAAAGAISLALQRPRREGLAGEVVRLARIEIAGHAMVYRVREAALAVGDQVQVEVSTPLEADAPAGAAVTLENASEVLTEAEINAVSSLTAEPPAWSYDLGWGRVELVLGPEQVSAGVPDPAAADFLQRPIHPALETTEAIRQADRSAREISAETALAEEAAARAEALRRHALYGQPVLPYRLGVAPSLELDRGDVVRVRYRDRDRFGNPQIRLGGEARFLVLGATRAGRAEELSVVRFLETP